MLLPTAHALGIDPVHFGVVAVVNIMIGLVTPPYGLLLFMMVKIAEVPLKDIVREVMPFLAVMIGALALITLRAGPRALPAAAPGLQGVEDMLGRAAVAMWWDVPPEVRAEWEDWHTHEHMPERLAHPGVPARHALERATRASLHTSSFTKRKI